MTNQNFDQIINEQYNFGRMITLFYPLLWLVNKLFPLEKGKILFCTKLGQFSGNAKYFFIYLVKNQRMKAIWKADDKKTYDHISEQFGKQNVIFSKGIIGKLQYLYHYLSANTILIRGRVDAWDLMRLGVKKNKIIMNIGHGSPGPGMKGGGGSMWENVHRRKLNREIKTRRAVTHYVTGSELSRYFMAAGTLVEPSKIHITGMPRTDFIIDGLNNLKSIKNKITSLIKTNMNYDKVILYAPTFREEVATKFFPFKDFSSSYLFNVLKKK